MTRFRVECGDRVVEVQVSNRAEALKAFNFACRGVLEKSDSVAPAKLTRVEWRVRHEVPNAKIQAIRELRNVSGLSLKESKDVVEAGAYCTNDADGIRAALHDYVEFTN